MLALLLVALQEPAPAPAPEPVEPPVEEPAPQEQDAVSLEDISAAVEKVSTRMAEVSASFRETAADGDVAPGADELAGTLELSRTLVADMEELLALIPEPPPPPPQSGGGGGQTSPNPQDGNQLARDRPPSESDPQSEQDSQDENQANQDNSERPPDAPISTLLQMPRDGEWGNLPPRLQQTIDAASANEVPLRYRRWLVEYHRRAGVN